MLELQVILVLMIIGAVVAMEIEDLLSSVIALGAVGIGLSLQFLLLKAPDLAITQLVVEIISLVLLIKATVGVDTPSKKLPSNWASLVFGCVFVALFLILVSRALVELPAFGEPIMKIGGQYAREALRRTHAANIVSAVILDFRAYDTLGEATILFTSVMGVLAIVRLSGRKR